MSKRAFYDRPVQDYDNEEEEEEEDEDEDDEDEEDEEEEAGKLQDAGGGGGGGARRAARGAAAASAKTPAPAAPHHQPNQQQQQQQQQDAAEGGGSRKRGSGGKSRDAARDAARDDDDEDEDEEEGEEEEEERGGGGGADGSGAKRKQRVVADHMLGKRYADPPRALEGLRACIPCLLVKTFREFFEEGCENCNAGVEMADDRDVVAAMTTPDFEGLAAFMLPERSWVAKWQYASKFVPGVYALKVEASIEPPDLRSRIDEQLHQAGIPNIGEVLRAEAARARQQQASGGGA